MPAVSVIQIHPVKGFDAVNRSEARVLASGALEFDRRWALVDARGRFVNGKNWSAIHRIRTAFDLSRREMAVDGRSFSLDRQGADIARWFSEQLGETMEWREDAELGFPDDTDSPGPTVVSEASLAAVAGWFGVAIEQARRRFRANLEFAGAEPFWEDRLYGAPFQLGAAELQAINPCARCVVPSRDPLTGEQDTGFQKRFVELRKNLLPLWANPAYLDHYYRFAVNTRANPRNAGKMIRIGDKLEPIRGGSA